METIKCYIIHTYKAKYMQGMPDKLLLITEYLITPAFADKSEGAWGLGGRGLG